MSLIEKLMQGSIDMHVHHGPDPKVERRLDALDTVLQAQALKQRAIVLKSHEYPTVPVTHIISKQVNDIKVFGSLCLDYEVGGLNPHALEASAKMGAKVVWMPTFCSENDMAKKDQKGQGIYILDEHGKVLPVVDQLLDIIKHYNMILATGHLSAPECFALVDRALERGLTKIILTHPLSKKMGANFNIEEQRRLAAKGVFMEHCFAHTLYFMGRLDPMTIVEAARAAGVEHCILTTDLGQAMNPAPAEGMRMAIGTMLGCGLTERELEQMIKINPARLLDLD